MLVNHSISLVYCFNSSLHPSLFFANRQHFLASLAYNILSPCKEVSRTNKSLTKCLYFKLLIHSMHMEVCSIKDREDQFLFPNMCSNQEFPSTGLTSLCLYKVLSSIAICTRLQHRAVLSRLLCMVVSSHLDICHWDKYIRMGCNIRINLLQTLSTMLGNSNTLVCTATFLCLLFIFTRSSSSLD